MAQISEKATIIEASGTEEPWFQLDGETYFVTAPQVLHSNAGYYIGRLGWCAEDGEPGYSEPYSRESRYFRTADAARCHLDTGLDRRQCLELE